MPVAELLQQLVIREQLQRSIASLVREYEGAMNVSVTSIGWDKDSGTASIEALPR